MALPPTRSDAETNAAVAHAALKLAADQRFILGAGDAILAAIALGKFEVTLSTDDGCDPKALHDYFVSLGYSVTYPGLAMLEGPRTFQVADLFGKLWDEYWGSDGLAPHFTNPVRMTLHFGKDFSWYPWPI
jgi:uncharacterized glyoxalase superfamily protein PhnB